MKTYRFINDMKHVPLFELGDILLINSIPYEIKSFAERVILVNQNDSKNILVSEKNLSKLSEEIRFLLLD